MTPLRRSGFLGIEIGIPAAALPEHRGARSEAEAKATSAPIHTPPPQ